MANEYKRINNIVVISDTHFGCALGLCPNKVQLDEGGFYKASPLQRKVYKFWQYFWDSWIPKVTKNEDYILVHNGDIIDGVHHNAVTQISQNITDQKNIAVQVMKEIVSLKKCKAYYQIRGTEAPLVNQDSSRKILQRHWKQSQVTKITMPVGSYGYNLASIISYYILLIT